MTTGQFHQKNNRRLRLFVDRKTGECVVAGHVKKIVSLKNNRGRLLLFYFFGGTGLTFLTMWSTCSAAHPSPTSSLTCIAAAVDGAGVADTPAETVDGRRRVVSPTVARLQARRGRRELDEAALGALVAAHAGEGADADSAGQRQRADEGGAPDVPLRGAGDGGGRGAGGGDGRRDGEVGGRGERGGQ